MSNDIANIELKFSGLGELDTKPYDPIEQALIDGLARDRVCESNGIYRACDESGSSHEVSNIPSKV